MPGSITKLGIFDFEYRLIEFTYFDKKAKNVELSANNADTST